jgi:ribosomal protein L40E
LRTCELCGNENPDEARFCMKCGKDMESTGTSGNSFDALDDPDTFTPLGDDEYARLSPTRRAPSAPVGDVASYKEAAAAAALQAQHESEEEQKAEQVEQDLQAPPEPAEIDHRGKVTDFVAMKQFCSRCGMANPHDQRFCKNCGSTLGEAPGGMADRSFEAPPQIQAPAAPIETTTLSDVSPSSAYSEPAAQEQGRRKPPRDHTRKSGRPSGGGMADWEAKEWLGLTAVVIVVIALIYMIFFGGFNAIFNSVNNNIKKAGATMEKLPGFQFNMSSIYELDQGQYGGGGHVLFETPDKSAWEVRRDTPGNPQVQGTIQVAQNTYMGTGGKWQPGDPTTTTGNVLLMWQQFSGSEGLPKELFGSHTCFHYKYRMTPELMKTVLGLTGQDGVSDVIMETWIDTTTFQVVHQTAQVFGAEIDGVKIMKITLVMDLVETGKTYGIKPPM